MLSVILKTRDFYEVKLTTETYDEMENLIFSYYGIDKDKIYYYIWENGTVVLSHLIYEGREDMINPYEINQIIVSYYDELRQEAIHNETLRKLTDMDKLIILKTFINRFYAPKVELSMWIQGSSFDELKFSHPNAYYRTRHQDQRDKPEENFVKHWPGLIKDKIPHDDWKPINKKRRAW